MGMVNPHAQEAFRSLRAATERAISRTMTTFMLNATMATPSTWPPSAYWPPSAFLHATLDTETAAEPPQPHCDITRRFETQTPAHRMRQNWYNIKTSQLIHGCYCIKIIIETNNYRHSAIRGGRPRSDGRYTLTRSAIPASPAGSLRLNQP